MRRKTILQKRILFFFVVLVVMLKFFPFDLYYHQEHNALVPHVQQSNAKTNVQRKNSSDQSVFGTILNESLTFDLYYHQEHNALVPHVQQSNAKTNVQRKNSSDQSVFGTILNESLTTDTQLNTSCTNEFKRNHYIIQDFHGGRTGSVLCEIYCLLALSAKFCYTAVVDPTKPHFKLHLKPYFDWRNIEFKKNFTNTSNTFQVMHRTEGVLSEDDRTLSDGKNNWTVLESGLNLRCLFDQEQFVRSSFNIKETFTEVIEQYKKNTFPNRSIATIHVRRTDKLEGNSLLWYEPYIQNAMKYLRGKQHNVSFIFVSDDIAWCKEHFNGSDVHFSPFKESGYDFALIARSHHVILTIGNFGWNGAWINKYRSVFISEKVKKHLASRKQLLPGWTVIYHPSNA